jgi:hypothetical protein
MTTDHDTTPVSGKRWAAPEVHRVRDEAGFTWLPGGPDREMASEGNGQPQRDRGWGLWRASTRSVLGTLTSPIDPAAQ